MRVIVVVVAAALALAGAPVPADALFLDTFTFAGGGWGHGLGMSQWGAKGLADQGRAAPEILAHYYAGTTVGDAPLASEVRVGLVQDSGAISFTASALPSGSGVAEVWVAGQLVGEAQPGETWTITPTAEGRFNIDGGGARRASSVGSTSGHVYLLYAHRGTLVKLQGTGNRYRHGVLEVSVYNPAGTYRVRAVAGIPSFDDYTLGIAEVPSSWPSEALKAQAIAARTYAAEKVGRLGNARPGCYCGVYDSTFDQVYAGYEKEAGASGERWVDAVGATRGKLVLHQGAPIQAFYSSSSGGHTEHNENVWGSSPVPYLRGVADPTDSVSPHFTWQVSMAASEVEAKLNARPSTAVGTLRDLELVAPLGVSGRVTPVLDDARGGVRIVGTVRTARVSGETFRSALGLKSTLVRIGGAAAPGPVSVDPAPAAGPTGILAGTSFKRGRARRGVVVSYSGPASGAVKSGRKGAYAKDLPPGSYTVTAAAGRRKICGVGAPGGQTSFTVDVAAGGRSTVDWHCWREAEH